MRTPKLAPRSVRVLAVALLLSGALAGIGAAAPAAVARARGLSPGSVHRPPRFFRRRGRHFGPQRLGSRLHFLQRLFPDPDRAVERRQVEAGAQPRS